MREKQDMSVQPETPGECLRNYEDSIEALNASRAHNSRYSGKNDLDPLFHPKGKSLKLLKAKGLIGQVNSLSKLDSNAT